jgi:hypothetical protein
MKKLLILLLTFLPCVLFAQTRKVSGTYTYYANPSMSVKQAMTAAIENAKIQALAKEFGTSLQQSTISEMGQTGSKESESFNQLSIEEVKGEWIEDTKEPETKITATMNDGTLVIEAKVWGKARAVTNKAANFEASVLRNGTEKRFASAEFKEGDQMYVYFVAPADGYVCIYFVDESKTVSCLLPYAGDSDGQQPVKHGKEYVFFSSKYPYDVTPQIVDEYPLTCSDDIVEHDQLYVIYSPNPFTKAVDRQTNDKVMLNRQELSVPRQLSFDEFQKWLGQLSARDKEMGKKIIRLSIMRN